MASKWPIEAVLGGTLSEIRFGVSWDDYCEMPALNPSTIAPGIKSLKHLLHAWEKPSKETDSLGWGRAVHCLLFEPREFEHRYVTWRGGKRDMRCEPWRNFYEAAKTMNQEILTEDQLETALAASQSFLKEPAVQRLISAGRSEVTILAVEEGIQCRGRMDWLASAPLSILTDLKTTKDISPRPFSRDFYRYKYDVKLGLYQRWLDRVTGIHWPCEIICLENVAPYDVAVMPIADAVLERGAEKGLRVIRQLREVLDSGADFPGVGSRADYCLDTPTWEMDEEEVEYDEVTA